MDRSASLNTQTVQAFRILIGKGLEHRYAKRFAKRCTSPLPMRMRKPWTVWVFSEAERSIQRLGTRVNGQRDFKNGRRQRARAWRGRQKAVRPCGGSFTTSDRIPGRAAQRDHYRFDPRLRRTRLGNRKTPRRSGSFDWLR